MAVEFRDLRYFLVVAEERQITRAAARLHVSQPALSEAMERLERNVGATLLGKPAYESSVMTSALTAGSKILIFGDFRYFLIVDRIGMNLDLIPHLFGASNRPTGQRGLYAFWRNSCKVLDINAFRMGVTG